MYGMLEWKHICHNALLMLCVIHDPCAAVGEDSERQDYRSAIYVTIQHARSVANTIFNWWDDRDGAVAETASSHAAFPAIICSA